VPYYWIGFRHDNGSPKQGTDLAAIESGHISVSPLHLNMTNMQALKKLKASFG